MNNNQIDAGQIIEELGNQIGALNVEIAILKARIKAFENSVANSVQNSVQNAD
jgi:hypothetical protein